MIAGSARIDPYRSEVMSVEAKTAIIEHLGRQHQAMVNLLADLVNIDSGSYNKRAASMPSGIGCGPGSKRRASPAKPFRTMFLAIAWRRVSPAPVEATRRSC
jgi:hypothetical protein